MAKKRTSRTGQTRKAAKRPEMARARAPQPVASGGEPESEMLLALRKHVVLLDRGSPSQYCAWQDSEADLGAIADKFVPAWLQERKGRTPAHLVLVCCDALDESKDRVRRALAQAAWWLAHDIYPLFVIWDQDFALALKRLAAAARSPRAPTNDDSGVDDLASRIRQLGGPQMWDGLERGAELAAAGGGALRDLLRNLQKQAGSQKKTWKLHAVAEGTGSLLLHAALAKGLFKPPLTLASLQLLLPACSLDSLRYALNQVGKKIERITVYGERAGSRIGAAPFDSDVSRLDLVQQALMPPDSPVCGLEETLRQDTAVARKLGLGGYRSQASTEVIWLCGDATRADDADDDATTLQLDGKGDAHNQPHWCERVLRATGALPKQRSVQTYEGVDHYLSSLGAHERSLLSFYLGEQSMAFRAFTPPGATTSRSFSTTTRSAGQKRALCIGINEYPKSPLGGCVSDAKQWADWLTRQGFEVKTLLDAQATRRAILDELHSLIESSQAGDTTVIQFAGHGTQVPDFNGDEDVDEALVPIDHRQVGYIIDDDIAEITDNIKAGAHVTFFMDCCHSGSNTRALFDAKWQENEPRDVKVRVLFPDEEMIRAHRKSREDVPASRDQRQSYSGRREVLFSACKPIEKALESGGQGHFTRAALEVLREHSQGWTNQDFITKVLARFGEARRQTPQLWSDAALYSSPFLGGTNGEPPSSSAPGAGAGPGSPSPKDEQIQQLKQVLLELAQLLEKWLQK